MNHKIKSILIAGLVLLAACATSFAGTVAYWELDGTFWDLKDSVAWYDVTPGTITVTDSNLKANPIPNPDPFLPWSGDGDDSAVNPLASWFTKSQYFYVPNDSDPALHDRTFDFYPEKSFTAEGWFRPLASGLVVGNQHSSNASHQFGGSFNGWRVTALSGGQTLQFEIDGAAYDDNIIIDYDPSGSSDPNEILYNNLHHFAAIYKADLLQMELYVDGQLVGTNTVPEAWIADTWTVHRGGSLSIGGRDLGDGNFTSLRFTGGIDEIRYSNIALHPKDFLNARRTVAYWELDGAAWAADPNDSVGDNHLTAFGAVTDSALFVDPIPNPDRSQPFLSLDDAATNASATFFTSSDGADGFYIPNTNDPLTHDTTFDFNPEKSFTVDGWFRAQNSGTIVGNAHSAAASHQINGGYTGWRFYTTGGGTVLKFECDGSANGDKVTLETPIEANTLYHFAGAFDADAQQMRLYLDGKLVASSDVPDTWGFSRGGSLAIGARDAGTGFNSLAFTGAIDEIRYSAYAFEQEDLLNYVKPVIAYWELDGDTWDGMDAVGDRDMTILGTIEDSALVVDPVPNRETSSPWYAQEIDDDEFYNPVATWFTAEDTVYVPNSDDPQLHDGTFDIDPTQSITVEGWFRPTNSGTIIGNQHVGSFAGQFGGGYKGWRVFTTDGGTTLNFEADGQATSGGQVVLSAPCQQNVLQSFAAVFDADVQEMRLYLDRQLVDSASVPGTWSAHRGGAIAIGGRDNGDGTFSATAFVGAVDEVRLINRALDPQDFLDPFDSTAVPECGDYGYLPADFNKDCYVNFDDLLDMMFNWLVQ